MMRVPKFVKIMPEVYDPDTFQPTEFDIANAKAERQKHVTRVRRDPETGGLKSNTNIFRWSDGSMTISVGGEHYEIGKKKLAPGLDEPYNELEDAHYYAAAAELSSNVLMVVGHVTEQYSVKPNKDVGDDALSILAEKMAQASKPSREGDFIVKTTIDPELQSRQAEQAEKERLRAQRKRENAAARMDGGLGRSGRGGGLSVGDLEGGRRTSGVGRKRGAGGSKPRRRNNEYDSDDEGMPRKEEYDMDDGFLVSSGDEDEAESGADDDEEELLDDEEERPRRNKRRRTQESDEDASGDDVGPAEASSRARRRNVIDDDDSE
jgi:RNA polymerase-associated protein LEO1